MKKYFKIGEISKLYNIGVDSLRYYEELGILKPLRSESGYRLYSTRDLWLLNVIRDLRQLGFGMEQIRQYLQPHTLESTVRLLEEERQAIGEKMRFLQGLLGNVEKRLDTIERAEALPLESIRLQEFSARQYYLIPEGYSDDHEMDVLIQKLRNMDREHLYVIGNNQIGTVIPLKKAAEGRLTYQAVFVFDENGKDTLPGGQYLSVAYAGSYEQSREWILRLLDYADRQGLQPVGEVLELLWVDIHMSAREEEHITELQIRVE